MSIYLYEEAIISKMREITGDDRIIITPSENIYNIIPRIQNDDLKLPLIHVVRNNWKLTNNKNHGLKMNGQINNQFPMFDVTNNIVDGKIHRLHTIPINFSHTFEVWSRTRQENDEIIRELIWFFSTMGEFTVHIPYGLDIDHVFTLELLPDIVDNTEILNQKNTGELFLQSIITNCSDAYLWKSSSHNPTCIEVSAEIAEEKRRIIKGHDYNELKHEQKRMET